MCTGGSTQMIQRTQPCHALGIFRRPWSHHDALLSGKLPHQIFQVLCLFWSAHHPCDGAFHHAAMALMAKDHTAQLHHPYTQCHVLNVDDIALSKNTVLQAVADIDFGPDKAALHLHLGQSRFEVKPPPKGVCIAKRVATNRYQRQTQRCKSQNGSPVSQGIKLDSKYHQRHSTRERQRHTQHVNHHQPEKPRVSLHNGPVHLAKRPRRHRLAFFQQLRFEVSSAFVQGNIGKHSRIPPVWDAMHPIALHFTVQFLLHNTNRTRLTP